MGSDAGRFQSLGCKGLQRGGLVAFDRGHRWEAGSTHPIGWGKSWESSPMLAFTPNVSR